jgi:hypothetical protein
MPQHTVLGQFGEFDVGDHLGLDPDGVRPLQRASGSRRAAAMLFIAAIVCGVI